jgi:hypothetical protein
MRNPQRAPHTSPARRSCRFAQLDAIVNERQLAAIIDFLHELIDDGSGIADHAERPPMQQPLHAPQ